MLRPCFPAAARPLAALLPLLALAACGHALPEIPHFDAATWRLDRYACQNRRAALLPALLAARPQLLDARADDLTQLLGRPDEEVLLAQTEKTYVYYLQPGSQCAPRHPHADGPRLRLHLGPLGTVTEVQADPLGGE